MQAKIEVEKTYWFGMTATQRDELKGVVIELTKNDAAICMDNDIPFEAIEMLNELRQTLITG